VKRVLALVLFLALVAPFHSAIARAGSPAIRKFTLHGWSNNCGGEQTISGIEYYGQYAPFTDLCIRSGFDQSIATFTSMYVKGTYIEPGIKEFDFFLVPNHIDPATIVPFPWAMTIASDAVVHWDCAGGHSPIAKAPYDCTPYHADVRAILDFPYCWSGKGDDVVDAVDGLCPPDNPVPLAHLRVDLSFFVQDGTGATFTGGAMAATFTNGYQPDELAEVTHDCINVPTSCGAFTNWIHRDWPT
jgi:hypothetical protein